MRMRQVLACGLVCGFAFDGAAENSTADFDGYLADCEAFGFSGAVLVARDGKVLVQKGFGVADRAGGARNTPETRFEIASASKQITAAAVLKLHAAGKLSIDDSIAKRLPGVPNEHKGVTIRHLLNHTSGFPRMGPGGFGPDLATAVAGYLKGRRTAEPGKRFEYWNGGYALLAGIVETTSGTSFVEFCRKELFEPAGMTSTGFCGDAVANAAHGYQDDKDVGAAGTHSFGWEYRGMGGVVTTVGDLWKWDRALRTDAVLPAAAREILFAPALQDYACGWNVVRLGELGRVAEHGGTVDGFETEMIRCLDRDAAVFVVANRRDVGWQVGYRLAGMLLGDGFTLGNASVPPLPPRVVDLPADQVARVTGRYALPSGATFVVRAEGRGVLVGAEGQEALDALTGVAPDRARWRAERDVCARIVAGLAKGDASLVREKVVDAFWSKEWPGQLVDSIWPAHVAAWGALKSSEEIGARSEGRSVVRTWIRLHHEKGERAAEVVLADGRLTHLDLQGREFPAQARYAPVGGDAFAGYDFGRPVPAAIVFANGADSSKDELRLTVAGTKAPLVAKRRAS